MQIVFQCAFEQEPLRLPSFPGNGDEFLMELGIYFWSKLHRVGHDLTLRHSIVSLDPEKSRII